MHRFDALVIFIRKRICAENIFRVIVPNVKKPLNILVLCWF